jgi:hypothetical protein
VGQLLVAQSWVTINSPRGNFSFSFPTSVPAYDTLSLLSYINILPGDSTISFQVNYIEGVYISGNDELQNYLSVKFGINSAGSTGTSSGTSSTTDCTVDSIEAVLTTYAQMYQVTTQGTIEGLVASDYTPCVIRGKELTIRHPNLTGDSGYYFAFTRYFYWGTKFLAFTVSGPEEKLVNIQSYKNQLFSSIVIH